MADTTAGGGGTSVGEIFLALGISPDSIQKMLETIRASTQQATASSPVTINVNVNAGQVQKQVEKATAVATEAAKPVEVPVVVQTADALFKLYKLNKEVQDFEKQRPDLKIDATAAAPAEAGIRAVSVAVNAATQNSAAFGHDFTHTLEIIGNAAQRLRGGLAEIAGKISEIKAEAQHNAQEDEVALLQLRHTLGSTAAEAEEFVEKITKSYRTLEGSNVTKATTKFYQFGRSMGYSGEEALASAEKFVTLAADLAKLNAKPFEEVLGALQTQLLRGGNSAAEYGIRVKEADVQQEALRLNTEGLTEGFSQEELAVARTNLIMKQAADVHERANAASASLTERQGVLKAQYNELLGSIGKYALQLAGPLVEALIGVVDWTRKFSDSHPTLTKGIVLLAGALGTLLTALTALAILTEITIAVKTGIAGIATILGVQAAATTAATVATGAHAVATGVDATALTAQVAAQQWAALEAHLHAEALWENAVAANADAVAQDRVVASAGRLAVAQAGAATATTAGAAAGGRLAAASGFLATIIGTVIGAVQSLFILAAGVGAAAVAATAALILLAAAVGALIGYGLYKLVDWLFPGLIKGMEKSAEKAASLAAANERLARSGATAADAAEVQADSIQKLIEAKKLDASWTEILTKEATADIALIKKHSATIDIAAERVKNYNRYLAEGFTTNEAFAQSMSKLARLSALTNIKRNGTLTGEQAAERQKIIDSLTDEEKVRAGILKASDAQLNKETNQKKILEQQKKIHEELRDIQKQRWALVDARDEAEAKATKNLETRLQLEKNLLFSKGNDEKREAHEKLGLTGPSPARDQVDSAIDEKTAQAVSNLEKDYARQVAEVKAQFEQKVRLEVQKTADDATHAEAEVAIARLANVDAYSAGLARVQLQQNEVHLEAIRAYREELKVLMDRSASQEELAALLKAFQTEEQNRVRKFSAERAKLAIEEAKKKEDAFRSSDKAALDAELSLAEARAKAEESLDGELAILKRREEEELKQARNRNAEQRELANIKRKFAAEALKQIEDTARASDKAAKKAAEDGRKALNKALEDDAISKDKREGRVAKAAFTETGNKLDEGLGNIHNKEDAAKFKEHSQNALKETLDDQKKAVDELAKERDKAIADHEAHNKAGTTSPQRRSEETDIAQKTQKHADAEKALAKATDEAVRANERRNAKADLTAQNAETEEKARKRLIDRAKEEAAAGGPKAGDPGAAAGPDGAKPAEDTSPIQKALEAATGGLKDLPAVAQGLIKAAADMLDASKVLPQVSNALNGLVTGQSAFFQGLTEFGTSVVAKITAQQAELKTLTATVEENKKALDNLNKNDPQNNDNTAAALGGD